MDQRGVVTDRKSSSGNLRTGFRLSEGAARCGKERKQEGHETGAHGDRCYWFRPLGKLIIRSRDCGAFNTSFPQH